VEGSFEQGNELSDSVKRCEAAYQKGLISIKLNQPPPPRGNQGVVTINDLRFYSIFTQVSSFNLQTPDV
jgi:hypothetical protein